MAKDETIIIDSADSVWMALERVLNDDFDPTNVQFDFEHADWAAVEFKFEGAPYNATIPTSVMKGIVDFQSAMHRSAALILRNKARLRNLSSDEISEYELVFRVEAGSSKLLADASEAVKSLAHRALDKMNDKDAFICALVFMGLFFTGAGGYLYLNHALEMEKVAVDSKKDDRAADQLVQHDLTIRQLSTDGLARDKILTEALKQSEKAKLIKEESEQGFDSVVRNADRVDVIVLQGTSLTKKDVEDITRRHRRSSKKMTFIGRYRVEGVDTTDPKSFMVKLRDEENGDILMARLDDAIGMEKFKAAIQKAEWGRTLIRATISGRMVGDDLKDARILKANTARRSRSEALENREAEAD